MALLLVACAFLANAVWDVYWKYERSKTLAGKAASDLKILEARRGSLAQSIADLETDAGREREAREKFGVVKPGERLIVLVDGDADDQIAARAAARGWTDWWRGWWGNWRQKLLGLFGRD